MSVLSVGELRKGAALLARRGSPSAHVTTWIDQLEEIYRDRLLPIDVDTTRIWADLAAIRSRPVVDTFLAATAIQHGLTFATRNVRDVQDTPVVLHNPWA